MKIILIEEPEDNSMLVAAIQLIRKIPSQIKLYVVSQGFYRDDEIHRLKVEQIFDGHRVDEELFQFITQ